MMMGKKIGTVWLMTLICAALAAQSRSERLLEKGWKFSRGDSPKAMLVDFDDAGWERVVVPHDWAITGPFDANSDGNNGRGGLSGGLPFTGVGWYRLRFDCAEFGPEKAATILFDGAMSNARVFLNEREIGHWPYGYNSFHFDITPYLKNKNNILAVRLDNPVWSSRWYPGAGLYRNVHLLVTDRLHIPVWGTQILPIEIDNDCAEIFIKTQIVYSGNLSNNVKLVTKIFKQTGLIASGAETLLSLSDSKGHDTTICRQSLSIASPDLWSPDSPTLYTAVSQLYADGILKDEYVTTFGVKNLEIIPQKGMFLNGEPFKFKGVCLHHDLGPLGAAVNRSAISRQLSLLKEMGCNAIRTAHNMPAPELVELCDRMGFMLIAESFDEWEFPKCVNGYHLYFNKWAEKDLTNLVKHYRNNPSVALWSIGNEVPDMAHPGAVQKLRRLQDVCHREDPTRKVTMGMDMGQQSLDNYCAATIDVPGLNYRLNFYHRYYQSLPQQTVLGTETVSSFSSRGEYFFPVERTADTKHVERQSSSYDVECASWGNLPEDDWVFQDDYPWCIGEFVWTGFDYLGEPTPYNEWPNHSSTFGIIDLAGIPKDRYFLYRSRWNSGQQTVHIVPHWTWPGREGQITPVFVYTNHPSAELFVNGHSQGRRHKNTSLTEESTAGEEASRQLLRQSRYRLMWPDVKYEAGTLKVVCYDVNGKIVAEKEIHTAGKPHHLELTADRNQLSADGKDLAFITVRVVDKDGNLCPAAKHAIRFKVSGEGLFRAAANGDPTCLEPFRLPEMHAFNGQLTAIVQSTEKAGKITFEAQTQGVKKCSLNLITN